MFNFNGELLDNNTSFLNEKNRGVQLGDAVFEELRVLNGDIIFLEDHYLRLMSSMRILRMEIPMNFTMEFMEEEILKILSESDLKEAKQIKFTVFRNSSNDSAASDNSISYFITSNTLINPFFILNEESYEVELFKDFYKNSSMLSNLDTNNKVLNVVGAIYAQENDYQDCLLLNERKQVIEALNGNLFVVKGSQIKTAPVTDGCINSILRKKLIEIISKLNDFDFLEESISPFELQKADELFIVNNIDGIISITKYRKKYFVNTTAKSLIGKLNAAARMSLTSST
ncbi:branched-chain amino acid aminotransferase [Maribacter caenipelagi]|uniref:branched-chain-amino-acid transaminase n=1 Tax=Maribacter caenipelagi TaxID=1447781 RepID=A0A4R7DL02_9FLAO|nr:aminotransferase class IV [Maribacter caenipelagi]TDS20864.1 branched-chain amino acid aminotransferase [Maribacter caenipelagi]